MYVLTLLGGLQPVVQHLPFHSNATQIRKNLLKQNKLIQKHVESLMRHINVALVQTESYNLKSLFFANFYVNKVQKYALKTYMDVKKSFELDIDVSPFLHIQVQNSNSKLFL